MNSYFTKLSQLDALNALKPIAANGPSYSWSWCGKEYKKRKWSSRPDSGLLNRHHQVLRQLIRMVPTTRISRASLREVLKELHREIGIFGHCPGKEKLHDIATVAAARWCLMLKHCLVVYRGGWLDDEPRCDLHEVVKLIEDDQTFHKPAPPADSGGSIDVRDDCGREVCIVFSSAAKKRPRVEGAAYGRTRLRIADESPVVTLKGVGLPVTPGRSSEPVYPQATAAAEEMPEECSQTPAGTAPGGCPAEPDLPNRNTESTKAKANTGLAKGGRKRKSRFDDDRSIGPPFGRDPHDPPDDAEGLARIGFLTKCNVCRNPVLPNGTRCFRFFGVPYYFHFNCLASKAGQQLLADMRRASEV